MDVTVREASASEIRPLRHAVLRAGLPLETANLAGDLEPSTHHFAAEFQGKIVGCASIVVAQFEGEPAWQVRGMAVAPDCRGGGVGRKLLAAIEEVVRGSGHPLMWCNARVPAIAFYERMGWRVVSDEFEVPHAGPHRKMVKQITLTPPSPGVPVPGDGEES